MSVTLATLIGRAGRVGFRHYCEVSLGRPPPILPKERDLRSFGSVMEAAARREFSRPHYLQAWRDLQRIKVLSDRNGKDCIRFAAGQLEADIGDMSRSAFQEALFSFVDHRIVFNAAEVIMAQGRWGQSDRFCNVFQLDRNCRPETFAALKDAFKHAVQLMLQGLTGDTVSLDVDPTMMAPLLPIGAKPELHVLIVWGDCSEPIAILDESGPGLINPPVQRTAGLTLGPDNKTLTVFGVGLEHEGREKLARVFGDLILGQRTSPKPMPRLGFALHIFANPRALTFPTRSDIRRLGIDSLKYIPPECQNAVTQQITFPMTAWDSIVNERGEQYARGELSGACVLLVQFRIELSAGQLFAEARTIRGRLTRDGYVLESGLDVDRHIAEACFVHLGIYQRSDDLLKGVG